MSVLSRQLEKLFNAYHYPFQVIGSDQKILMVNRAFEKQLLGHEFVIGKDCCQGSETCRHKRFFETLEPYSDEFTIMLPNGQTISGRAQGAPIWANDDRILLGEAIVSIHKRPVESNSGLIGRSSVFNDLISRLEKAVKTQTPVLLLGETGTGKELAAEFIHQHSQRASHDFVVVDCTSISDELFESELFGHEKGAFTGAHSSKKGCRIKAHCFWMRLASCLWRNRLNYCVCWKKVNLDEWGALNRFIRIFGLFQQPTVTWPEWFSKDRFEKIFFIDYQFFLYPLLLFANVERIYLCFASIF